MTFKEASTDEVLYLLRAATMTVRDAVLVKGSEQSTASLQGKRSMTACTSVRRIQGVFA